MADPLETRPYACDDDLIAATLGDGQPRVRAYAWPDVAVVIGRGGKQELELDLAAISADRAPLYRRRGGGCAVVLDPGNAVVALTLPLPGIGGITSAFAAISAWLARGLEKMEVPGVKQLGVSDLVLGDRKIGGSCIYRTRGLLHYSTTLLVDPDLDLVERYLPHPPREPGYRRGRPHRQFMGRLAGTTPWSSSVELAAGLGVVLDAALADLSGDLAPAP